MTHFSLSHLANHVLRAELFTAVGARTTADAHELARVAEFDARRMHAGEGYSSMKAFLVGALKLSEDEAQARIRVARTAHEFPAIFPMIRDRRLSQTAVIRLAPCLSRENAEDLLAAAADKTIADLELLIAERFPKADMPTLVMAIAPSSAACDMSTGLAPGANTGAREEQDCIQVVSKPVETRTPRGKVTPLSPQRYALQFTVGQEARDLLAEAQALLGHAVPNGDVGEVFLRAMRQFVGALKKRRCGAGSRPRARRSRANGRYVPMSVKNEVWERDGGRCTFVSDTGHRCESRTRLELDHATPVARGGETTAANLRLRCRAHNQYAAEQAFGRGFMDDKREASRARRLEARAMKAAETEAKRVAREAARAEAAKQAEADRAAKQARDAAAKDVIRCLRGMGARAEEARAAAERSAHMSDASLEERVRVALQAFARGSARSVAHNGAGSA